ncbi:uncharacterized protein LOC133530252 [Cydia pomonella]|uniref:uncharacterized protein LOC133530252 n=1 Tax=Cydia pomonella TaxID=82600 RepID=UPI002ADE2D38|nr:uncharacterized protein LOC133530252 [Cydia pomonella]
MKSLFLLLIIYNLQNVAFSDEAATIVYKSYPKKVHPVRDNIKVINAGSFYKKQDQGKSFTRFQPPVRQWPANQKVIDSLPEDSNLFQFDFNGGLKSRVKKLPYFKDLRRSKRDANESKSEVTTKASATQKTEVFKPKENVPNVVNTPKNASLARRSGAAKSSKVSAKFRAARRGQSKKAARQGGAIKPSRLLRTFGKKNVNHKRGMRKRKSRSRVLRAGNDKAPKEKADRDKILKEKAGNDKALKEKAGNDKKPKEKAVDDKAPKVKVGNDKAPKEKVVNDKAPKVKAGNDKASKVKAGNDKESKEKAANEKVLKEKAVNAKQVQSPKGNAGKQARKAEAKRRAPSKRNPKARRPVASRRLISARDAKPEDYPYMVSIQKDNDHWCSGAILNPQLIISTANCFWKSKAVSRMKIRAGATSIDTGGQIAYIAEVRKHPNWSIRKMPENDIALALLDRQLKFSDAVHGVDLPNKVMIPPFNDVWVTSYGAERRDGVFSRLRLTLQVLYMRMLPEAKCAEITKRFGVLLHDSFFCLEQIGRRAPCTRDTGAPAVSDGVLWGLASWGIRKLCGTQRFPAMFSYVADEGNMDFIVNATSEMMGEERKSPFLDRPPIRPRTRILLPGEKLPEITIY